MRSLTTDKNMPAHKGQLPIAITMGEPAGIGPELIARIWRKRHELGLPLIIYVGTASALKAVDPSLPLHVLSNMSQIRAKDNALPILDIPTNASITPGTLNPNNGHAVIKSIDKAVQLALEGEVSAVVTAPIHKAALYQVGFDAPGHTEYLARLCGLNDDESVMMLTTDGLRVVPVTAHVPLKDVPTELTASKILHAGLVTAHDLKLRFGIEQPRIAIAGLNPHAGEDGTIGMEESTHIQPAIWALEDHGINVSGPVPADTLFHAEAREKYDAALCMYHDQALIPLKTLDFWGGINVTLGLPIIRTSPDHGTALSLAGHGSCRLDSMIAAIKLADEMAQNQITQASEQSTDEG